MIEKPEYIFSIFFGLFFLYIIFLGHIVPFCLGALFYKRTKLQLPSNLPLYIIYQIFTFIPIPTIAIALYLIFKSSGSPAKIIPSFLLVAIISLVRTIYQGIFLTNRLLFLENRTIGRYEFIKMVYKFSRFIFFYKSLYPRIQVALK